MNPMHISMNEFCFVQLPIGRGHDDNWERSVSFFGEGSPPNSPSHLSVQFGFWFIRAPQQSLVLSFCNATVTVPSVSTCSHFVSPFQ